MGMAAMRVSSRSNQRMAQMALTLLRVTQGTRMKPAQRGSGFATDAISAVAPPALSQIRAQVGELLQGRLHSKAQ